MGKQLLDFAPSCPVVGDQSGLASAGEGVKMHVQGFTYLTGLQLQQVEAMNHATSMITRHLPSRAINNNLEMINQPSPRCTHGKRLAPEINAA